LVKTTLPDRKKSGTKCVFVPKKDVRYVPVNIGFMRPILEMHRKFGRIIQPFVRFGIRPDFMVGYLVGYRILQVARYVTNLITINLKINRFSFEHSNWFLAKKVANFLQFGKEKKHL
jgi:hypothetical protein